MSVLIICYEWFLNISKNNKSNNSKMTKQEIMPNKNELNYFIDRLIFSGSSIVMKIFI